MSFIECADVQPKPSAESRKIDGLIAAARARAERAPKPGHFTDILCRVPAVDVPDPETVSLQWQAEFLRPGDGPLCLQGDFCLGLRLDSGYRLRVFRTPSGRAFFSLCLLCLSRAVLLNHLRGKPHVLFLGLVEFSARKFVLQDGVWRITP